MRHLFLGLGLGFVICACAAGCSLLTPFEDYRFLSAPDGGALPDGDTPADSLLPTMPPSTPTSPPPPPPPATPRRPPVPQAGSQAFAGPPRVSCDGFTRPTWLTVTNGPVIYPTDPTAHRPCDPSFGVEAGPDGVTWMMDARPIPITGDLWTFDVDTCRFTLLRPRASGSVEWSQVSATGVFVSPRYAIGEITYTWSGPRPPGTCVTHRVATFEVVE